MSNGKPWTTAEKRRVRELHEQGLQPADIANEMPGRKRSEVNGIMDRMGLKGSHYGVSLTGFPKPDLTKEWPSGCFKGQDVSAETLRREFTRIRDKPPVRAERFGVPIYG